MDTSTPVLTNDCLPEKKDFIQWVKDNKKILIGIGIGVGVLITAIVAYRNRAALKALWLSLIDLVSKSPKTVFAVQKVATTAEPASSAAQTFVESVSNTGTKVYEVSSHIRTLASGCNASEIKLATALAEGFELQPGQTWVVSYMKGVA